MIANKKQTERIENSRYDTIGRLGKWDVVEALVKARSGRQFFQTCSPETTLEDRQLTTDMENGLFI